MKVLIIGSGAREHTIAWKVAQSRKISKIFCAPGNAGIQQIAECINIKDDDIETLLSFALKEKIDLTIVGPEVPLVLGIVDRFEENGLKIFGPNKKAAMLEGSKKFSKDFMKKYSIPTAEYNSYADVKDAMEGLKQFNYPLVIKANGLAYGKGVIICNDEEEAKKTLKVIMENRKFGDAGNEVIIEEFLQGIEASLLCLVDGNKIVPLESAKDYKRLQDNDLGPNTGGMGCISPNKILDEKMMAEIEANILNRILFGFKKEEIEYKGVLFIGFMLTKEGAKVLEFNARLGDPETEVVLPRLKSDIIEIFLKTIDGTIKVEDLIWNSKPCISVVLASGGYPEAYEKGKVITGLEKASKDILIFHAGTKILNKLCTNGGRVLAVTTIADSIDEGRKAIYDSIKEIHFDGMQYRTDIGKELNSI